MTFLVFSCSLRAEEELARKTLHENAVPCPKCFTPIQRGEGCAHMTCAFCKQEHVSLFFFVNIYRYCDHCLDLIHRTKERGLCHVNINCVPESIFTN